MVITTKDGRKFLPFNINNYARVKLTKKGEEVLRKFGTHYDELTSARMFEFEYWANWYCASHKKEDSWWEFQMWELMEIFGSEMGMGMGLLFETEILIEKVKERKV